MEFSIPIFENLLETYATALNKNIVLAECSGTILIQSGSKSDEKIIQSDLNEFIKIGKLLSKPTYVTGMDDSTSHLGYIVSPFIHNSQNDLILTAGPFVDKNNIESIMQTIEYLFNIISSITETSLVQSHLKNKMQFMNRVNTKLFSFDETISVLLGQLRKEYRHIGFWGFAISTEANLFEITHTEGDISQLEGITFYLGEGILGQTIAAEKLVVWKDIFDTPRANFFTKLRIQPHHLLCVPAMLDHQRQGVFFAGMLHDRPFTELEVEIIHSFVDRVTKLQMLNKNLKSAEMKSEFMYMLVDFLDVLTNSNHESSVIYKLFDICIGNKAVEAICVTLENGSHFNRGQISDETLQKHKDYCHDGGDTVSHLQCGNLLHSTLQYKDRKFGVATIIFGSEEDKYRLEKLVNILLTVCSLRLFSCDKGFLEYNNFLNEEETNKLPQNVHSINNPKDDDVQFEIEKVRDLSSVIQTLPLTKREQEVLYYILEGLNNNDVAEHLYISTHTVKNHLTNIFRKLDVTDRVQAMKKIYQIKYND